jgi:hypothetical protein
MRTSDLLNLGKVCATERFCPTVDGVELVDEPWKLAAWSHLLSRSSLAA